ncbi:MAG TPA: DUF6602 domain-containing protein [Clostridia bacterium]|nr:DUF6602 domain-containing protein [Clostridia bacterium]
MEKNEKILNLFIEAGKQLRYDFEEIKKDNPHYGESGAEAEVILRDFLNDHLPKRFAADTGCVIDDESNISMQTDIIIYDALNSPIYRKGKRVLILPNDNVASVIEVKSKLNKEELKDAAKKIASAKALKKTPVNDGDQPVTMSPLVIEKTFGVVFAYESYTSLNTLSENLIEINAEYPSSQWIDMIVVLDKGIIGYTIQTPFSKNMGGWFAGNCDDNFLIAPFYVHLGKSELGELTLNKFFSDLIIRLSFYRKRSLINIESFLGKQPSAFMTLKGYQYNLERELVEVDDYHKMGNFKGATVKYNLFFKRDKKLIGQVGWIPWQDGAVICYTGAIPPQIVFQVYFDAAGEKGMFMPELEEHNFWMSSVIALKVDEFISITSKLSGDFYAERDCK